MPHVICNKTTDQDGYSGKLHTCVREAPRSTLETGVFVLRVVVDFLSHSGKCLYRPRRFLSQSFQIFISQSFFGSQWPHRLRRGSAAARLLGLCVRFPPGAWMSISCECCVLSDRGLCVGLITRPEESYPVWCI
jgi:hypothetical protein